MLELFRFAEAGDPDEPYASETLGHLRLVVGGQCRFSCCALELLGRGNRQYVSRLPAGTYVAERVPSSPSFDYPHLWIHDEGSIYAASDREGVKVHIANFVRQLRGCIAVGRRYIDLDGDGLLDVTRSTETLRELVDLAPAETELKIMDVPDKAAQPVPIADLEAPIRPIQPPTIVA